MERMKVLPSGDRAADILVPSVMVTFTITCSWARTGTAASNSHSTAAMVLRYRTTGRTGGHGSFAFMILFLRRVNPQFVRTNGSLQVNCRLPVLGAGIRTRVSC